MIVNLHNIFEDDSVIVKVGDYWRIKGKKVRYWNAKFRTKRDAQAALRAYWANKQESCLEYFKDDSGEQFLGDVYHYLRGYFGPSLYFDRVSNDRADLIYRGKRVALLMYDSGSIIVDPYEKFYSQVVFGDPDDFEIRRYLVDLVQGNVEA